MEQLEWPVQGKTVQTLMHFDTTASRLLLALLLALLLLALLLLALLLALLLLALLLLALLLALLWAPCAVVFSSCLASQRQWQHVSGFALFAGACLANTAVIQFQGGTRIDAWGMFVASM